ncbi:MAG: hypothetical protein NT173_02340 [Opitutales bacterium]|nr:hypothetical protein [Opitutales bacterium]
MNTWLKSALYGALIVFGALALVVGLAIAGCQQAVYPLARAFGSPPESELALCRTAFQQLQSRLATSRVRVEPVYCASHSQANRLWRDDLAQLLVREAGTRTQARFVIAPMRPDVGPTVFGHNQMRYLWERATAYSHWLKEAPPGADYVWCVEIFGAKGTVGAIQIYIFDAKGQVAYCRLFNSHQFGTNLSMESEEPIRLVVKTLFEDLLRDPKAVFPPYGVG